MHVKVRKLLIYISMASVIVFSFQNCSDFALQDQILYEQGLLESRDAIDAKYLQKLLVSPALKKWYKQDAPTFVNQLTLLGDQWTVVVAADKSITGKFLTINSGAGIQEASLSVVNSKLRATRNSTTGTPYAQYKEVALPSEGDSFVASVAFGSEKGDITILLNGVVQEATVQNSGTVIGYTNLAKSVVLTDPSSKVFEYVVYVGNSIDKTGKLSKVELNVMSRYVANNSMIPNVIFDPALLLEEGGGEVVVNPKFILAKSIFDAKCLSCHSGQNYPNLSNLTESKAIGNSLVKPKNLAGSALYVSLLGAGYSGIMPKGGSMSAAERQVIADWINSIQ